MTDDQALHTALEDLVDRAFAASADIGQEVESVLGEGIETELTREAAAGLLTRVIEALRTRLDREGGSSGTPRVAAKLSDLIDRAINARDRAAGRSWENIARPVMLAAHNGVSPGEVLPTPTFHTRRIPMRSGFMKLADIKLWDSNARLDIHLNQFRRLRGRGPTHDELAAILLGDLQLPGATGHKADAFNIRDLARSIAVNGLQKPPILSYSGQLLDGNRRITACRLVQASDEFTPDEKRNVERILVWQLTEFATPEDEDAVVVALNFESDYKEPWPEYVKARKVYEAWQEMLVLTPSAPHLALRRQLAKQFALAADQVNRYLKMIESAIDFEDYLVSERGLDEIEVKHRSNEYFQYFDELSKGKAAGGVAFTLNQNEAFKKLVFDLIYDGKFASFAWIRKLKHFDDDLWKGLSEARQEQDLDRAEELVERALNDAHARAAEVRQTGANGRIEAFVRFIERLPVKAFRDEITPENLRGLLGALELVKSNADEALARKEAGSGVH